MALYELEHELLISVRHHLQLSNPKTHAKMIEAINKIDAKRRRILYDESDDLNDQEDDFQKDISKAIDDLSDYLKKHLKG